MVRTRTARYRHEPAAMFSIIDGLVWPNIRVEVEVTAILPA